MYLVTRLATCLKNVVPNGPKNFINWATDDRMRNQYSQFEKHANVVLL